MVWVWLSIREAKAVKIHTNPRANDLAYEEEKGCEFARQFLPVCWKWQVPAKDRLRLLDSARPELARSTTACDFAVRSVSWVQERGGKRMCRRDCEWKCRSSLTNRDL
jgi:hypothetical protein